MEQFLANAEEIAADPPVPAAAAGSDEGEGGGGSAAGAAAAAGPDADGDADDEAVVSVVANRDRFRGVGAHGMKRVVVVRLSRWRYGCAVPFVFVAVVPRLPAHAFDV